MQELKVFYQKKDAFLLGYILDKLNLPSNHIIIDTATNEELLGDLMRNSSSVGIISAYCENLFRLAKSNMMVFGEVSLNLNNGIFAKKKQKNYKKLFIPVFYQNHEFTQKLKHLYQIEFVERTNPENLNDEDCYLVTEAEARKNKLVKVHVKNIKLSVNEKFVLFGRSFINLPDSIADKVIVHFTKPKELNIEELINSAFLNKKNVRVRTRDIAENELILEGKFKGLLNLSKVEEVCQNLRILGIYKEPKEVRI